MAAAPSVVDGKPVTNLPPVMVTGNAQQNQDYYNLWQWALLNRQAPPPATTSQTALNAYRQQQGGIWAQRAQQFYQSHPQHVSSEVLAVQAQQHQFEAWQHDVATDPNWALRDVGSGLGEMAIGALKGLGNSVAALPQLAFESTVAGYVYNAINQQTFMPQLQVWAPFTPNNHLEQYGANVAAVVTAFAPVGDMLDLANLGRASEVVAPELSSNPVWSQYSRDVPNTELLNQLGGVGAPQFFRTEGLGSHASIAELKATGALPGEEGVIITDRTVKFGDIYDLSTQNGRRVEFSLVTEKVDGSLVKKLYSGDAWSSPVPVNSSRLLRMPLSARPA